MKIGIRAYILLAVTVLLPLQAQAKTLSELLPQMVLDHERIKGYQDLSEMAYYSVEQAEGAWYPKLDLSGHVSRDDTDTNNKVAQTTAQWYNTQSLRAEQLLADFGFTDSAAAQYRAAYERQELTVVLARQGLIMEGVSAYLDVMRYAKALAYAIQAEESIKERWQIEDSRVEKGAGLKTDELQAKAQLAGATAARVGQENYYRNAINAFRSLFGYTPEDAEIQSFSLPVFPAQLIPATQDQAVDLVLRDNVELKMAKTAIDEAEKKVDWAKAHFAPVIKGFYSYTRTENDAGGSALEQETSYGATVEWNVLSGGSHVAQLRAARAGRSAAVNDLLDKKRLAEQMVCNAWVDMLKARDVSEWYHNQAVIQSEFLELARKQRDTKGTDQQILSDLLNAEVGYASALSGALSADVDMYQAAFRLLFSMGRLELDIFAN